MTCYWDTSALLALLFSEEASVRARKLAARQRGLPGYTSFFTFIEMESAYARRLAEGSLSGEDLSRLRLKSRELESALAVIWPDAQILDQARRMVPELGLRPADALQLASARMAADAKPGTALATFDERLSRAAKALGLAVAF